MSASSWQYSTLDTPKSLLVVQVYAPTEVLKKAMKPEVKKTYATEKLKEQMASENFRIETRNIFVALEHSTNLEEQWQMFVSGVTDSTAKIFGKRRGTNKERWISC